MELEEMQRHLNGHNSDKQRRPGKEKGKAADANKKTPRQKECPELQELRQTIGFYEETIQHMQKELFKKDSKNESTEE